MMSDLEKYNFYNNFLIEIRPRLQSVNVLVNLKKRFKSPKICLTEEGIFISDDLFYKIPCRNLNIIADSLNNVQITEKFLSFRFSTSNDGFGTFKSEILKLESTNDNLIVEFKFGNNSQLKLQCVNCSQTFYDSLFKRILPLPSEHSEPSDWFCHNHNSDSNKNLDPQEHDLFYSVCYCHLNSKISTGFLKSTTNLTCKRCLAWIGIIVNQNCFKIWLNTIQISDGSKTLKTLALEDVYLTIRNLLKDSLLNSTRIILRCRVNKDQIDYLLLWILEKRLNIIIDDLIDDFTELFVAKILFKFLSGENELVGQWTNDVTVSNVEISKGMMIDVLKHLYQMNKLLPKEWSSSNDFYISYLPLYGNKR